MKSSNHLRSPLSKARGLGSAKSGVHHWWMQRLSAIALVPLVAWFLYSFLTQMLMAERDAVVAWFHSPIHAIGTLLLITAMFFHARLGLQVVIEDYVHSHTKKNVLVIGINLLSAALTLISWVAIIKMHLTPLIS